MSTRLSRSSSQSVVFEALEDRLLLSAPPVWTSVGVGGGGSFFSPAFSPHNANEVYLASDMRGEYHSTDLGDTWEVLDFRQIQGKQTASVQFTNDPNILYSLGYNAQPSKSLDGGASWTVLPSNPIGNGLYLLADYDNPNRLIASNYSRIFLSANGGSSFSEIHYDSAGAYVAGAFFDGSNITIAIDTGLLVSADNGTTFNLSSIGGIPSGESIFSFAGAKVGGTTRYFAVTAASGDVYPGQQGNVHTSYRGVYSIDVGQANWTTRVTGIASGDHPVFVSMLRDSIDIAYLAGGSNNGVPRIYKTTNAGGAWTSVFQTTLNANIQTGWQGHGGDRGWGYGEYAFGLAVAPFDADKVMMSDMGAAYLSTDGGASWKAVYVNPADLNPAGQATPARQTYRGNGLEDTSAWWLTWTSAENVFASFTDIKAIRSTDGGGSWSFDYSGHSYNSMYQAIAHPTTGVLYGAVSTVHDIYQWERYWGDGYIDAGDGAVLYSGNEGANWSLLRDFGHPVVWIALDPNNANSMYVSVVNHAGGGLAGGIYYSSDINMGASASWTPLATPPRTEGHPFNIVVLNDGTLVATYAGRLNASWSFTPSSGVFVSTDNGATWLDRTASDMRYFCRDITIDPGDPTQSTWYVGVWLTTSGIYWPEGGLYKTTDRGQHWTLVPGTSGMKITQVAFNPTGYNEMYMTTVSKGLWYASNAQSPSPTFSQVPEYTFGTPERVFFNPYDPSEVWIASFGNGLHVGVQDVTAGDANGDGAVNVFDLAVLANNYGQAGKLWPDGDFTGDGLVNVFDLAALANNYGTTAGDGGSGASAAMSSPQPTVADAPPAEGASLEGEGHAWRDSPSVPSTPTGRTVALPVDLVHDAAVALHRMPTPILSAAGEPRLGPHSELARGEAMLQHWRSRREPRHEVDGEPVDLLSPLQLPSLLVQLPGDN